MDDKLKIKLLDYWDSVGGSYMGIPKSLKHKISEDEAKDLSMEVEEHFGRAKIGVIAYKRELENNVRDKESSLRHKEVVELQKKQNKFNLVLALATTALAIGIFLQITLYMINEGIKIRNFHWFFQIISIFGIGILLAFMGGIIIALIIILTKKMNLKKTENLKIS